MAAQVLFLHLVTIALYIAGAHAWKCAKYQHYFSQQPDYIDCLWDCCGNSFQRHCCAPIGVIVGCSILGVVFLAGLAIVLMCWWQKKKAQFSRGPKLSHNKRHSHYPVAPASVIRPAPFMPYTGPGSDPQYRKPPGFDYKQPSVYEYRPPLGLNADYRQGPVQEYRPGPVAEKPSFDDYDDNYDSVAPHPVSYKPAPPSGSYYEARGAPRNEKAPLDPYDKTRMLDM